MKPIRTPIFSAAIKLSYVTAEMYFSYLSVPSHFYSEREAAACGHMLVFLFSEVLSFYPFLFFIFHSADEMSNN